MDSRRSSLTIILVLGSFLASACGAVGGSPTSATPTPLPIVAADIEIVAEGRIMPRESVQLAFTVPGQVAEVLVEEGDQVEDGQVVARLENREELEAAIANAEVELLAAQQALDKLNQDVALARAEVVRTIAAVNREVRDAQYQLDNFTIPTNQANLTAMDAVFQMKQRLDQARDAFEPYKYRASGNDTREDLKEKLDQAQSDYNSAVRRLEYETRLEEAHARLDQALLDYQALQSGPDPDDLAAAQARLNAAKATLESARAARADLDLLATISGTVVKLDLIVGQQVSPGVPVMQIADFSQMYAETDDLDEIEVVEVSEGQAATVIPDSLPDLEIVGTVESIGQVFEEKRGDITYTARILLSEVDPRLRWGMTVEVTFKK